MLIYLNKNKLLFIIIYKYQLNNLMIYSIGISPLSNKIKRNKRISILKICNHILCIKLLVQYLRYVHISAIQCLDILVFIRQIKIQASNMIYCSHSYIFINFSWKISNKQNHLINIFRLLINVVIVINKNNIPSNFNIIKIL